MKIGIRKEDKNEWERRVPLTPEHVRQLVDDGVEVTVEPSPTRAFADEEYKAAGARLGPIDDSQVLFAVKEIPERLLASNRTYIYFAHVIKGQAYNMPMLGKILDLGATLIDYEKVVDDKGRRLIFFGRHAGLAGMLDSLWAFGKRLEAEGKTNPLATIRMAHSYANLDEAKASVSEAGKKLAEDGFDQDLAPVVVGFAGYGNVSQGAQEILDLLPHEEIAPADLPSVLNRKDTKKVFKVVFKEEHMARPKDKEKKFVLQQYYEHPELFRGIFARHVPYLTLLVNCIYWTPDYPRLVSRDLLHGLFGAGHKARLKVIGDISIDIEGAIECSLKSTDPGNPVYVYLPDEDRIEDGVNGHGPVVMAVDNLPCELPVESSTSFGDALLPFVKDIASADYTKTFDELPLPQAIKKAVIAHKGKLTPDYEYLYKHLQKQGIAVKGGAS